MMYYAQEIHTRQIYEFLTFSAGTGSQCILAFSWALNLPSKTSRTSLILNAQTAEPVMLLELVVNTPYMISDPNWDLGNTSDADSEYVTKKTELVRFATYCQLQIERK